MHWPPCPAEASKECKQAVSAKRPDPDDKRIGRLLRTRRLLCGMSQVELGKSIGVSFQQVQKYERGINRVGAGRLSKLAEALGVSAGYFFTDGPGREPAAASNELDELMLDKKNLRALAAFSRIGDDGLRDSFLDLVEHLADVFPKKAPTPRRSDKD